MRKPTLILFLVLAAGQCQAAEKASGNWNCWAGPAHNRVCDASLTLPAVWPKKLKILWEQKVGAGFSSPVCDGAAVYLQSRIDSNERITAYSLSDGKQLWQTPLGVIQEPQTHDPASTPACVEGALYIHSMTGAVFKLASHDGKIIWRRNLPAEWKGENFRAFYGVAAAPLILENSLLLPIGDKETGKALALKLDDGSTAWELPTAAPGYCSFVPLQLDETSCVATLLFHSLVVLKKDGAKFAPAFSFDFPGGADGNSAMPLTLGENRVLITSHDATVALSVFKGLGKYEEAWRLEMGGNLSAPVFVNQHIYLFNERELLCLDPANGRTLSSLQMDGQYGALLAWGTVLFCRLHDGTLKIVDISDVKMKLLADYASNENGDCWSAPAPVSPSRLLMRGGEKLQCLSWENPNP